MLISYSFSSDLPGLLVFLLVLFYVLPRVLSHPLQHYFSGAQVRARSS